jgi:ubiquinone/menaquinone biosynthesis C-methylase UbiE
MKDWINELFVRRSDLFLKLMNQRWPKTEELVNGMMRVLDGFGVRSGNLLDLCCGNGRISVFMAKKGFQTVGVDISEAFLKDGRKKAEEHGVNDRVAFLLGDVRRLKGIVKGNLKPFDVAVNAWTSIGYYSQNEDLNIFKQARYLSKVGTILFIVETMHTEYLSIKSAPTSYAEIDNLVLLEHRKYDTISARVQTSWTFYNRRGQDLEYVDTMEFSNHIYSPSELASLLTKAGWETVAFYGNISTLQPMSPLTALNLVAKAV